MEYAVRLGSPESPTTAQVSQSSSMNLTHAGSCQSAMTGKRRDEFCDSPNAPRLPGIAFSVFATGR